jgi:alpha-glucosidase
VYQIYPRSFADTNGDGIGDLEGVRAHLDHLVWLGVDAIWLSPFYRSPMADFGYDVSDHCEVDPLFGTLEDFDVLVTEAHERAIRVIVDLVPNHTSDQHEWFTASRSSRDDPKRDWYVWRDPAPDGGPPNNWISAFTHGPAWTFDDATGQYYLHLFLPEQPDLDWANEEVVEAMHGVMRFWLDRGVDGFRIDVVHAIGKDPALPDDPPELVGIPKSGTNDEPSTHALLRDLRTLVDAYPGERMMVGEVFLLSTAKIATYYGDGDELHLAFNFPAMFTAWDAAKWRRRIERAQETLDPRGAWPTWVLSNHDNARHRTRFGSEARARAAAVLLLGLRGTPFLYAGEELGLEDALVPADRVVDPGGRDGCRAPFPWTPEPDHGWGTTDPWLPWPPDPSARSAEVERDDPTSVLHLYRRLLEARRGSPALTVGDLDLLDAPDGVLAFRRTHEGEQRTVVVHMGDGDVAVPYTGTVAVASDGAGEGEPFDGTIGPDQAVVLRS